MRLRINREFLIGLEKQKKKKKIGFDLSWVVGCEIVDVLVDECEEVSRVYVAVCKYVCIWVVCAAGVVCYVGVDEVEEVS